MVDDRTLDELNVKPKGWTDAAWERLRQDARLVECPSCGKRAVQYGTACAAYCGPHQDATGRPTPMVEMREVEP